MNGIVRNYIFTNLDLHDGVRYYVTLIACNGAELCTTSVSEGMFVDTTPPSRGNEMIYYTGILESPCPSDIHSVCRSGFSSQCSQLPMDGLILNVVCLCIDKSCIVSNCDCSLISTSCFELAYA